MRKSSITACMATEKLSFIDEIANKFSSYRRLTRTVAYCRRFSQNCRLQPNDRPKTDILTPEEVEAAETALISLVQQQEFNHEWQSLHQGKPVSTTSRLRWFHPFLADDQLIRIGGRLTQANLPYDTKHQILLPGKHRFSMLLAQHFHEKHLHAAPQLLISILRTRYWLIGAREMAKRIVHSCIQSTTESTGAVHGPTTTITRQHGTTIRNYRC